MGSNDWLGKDYYAVLGVSRGVSDRSLEKAYRKLTQQYHLDQNPDNREAEEKFKTIGGAYAVLSDPAQRKKYDTLRAMAAEGPRFRAGVSRHGTAADFEGAFSAMFTSGFEEGNGGSARYTVGNPDLDDILNMFSDAADAAERSRNFGAGASYPDFDTTFPNTSASSYYGNTARPTGGSGSGSGEGNRGNSHWFSFRAQNGADISASTKLTFKQTYNGATVRLRLREETITIRIPPGVHDGQKIRLRGKGQPGSNGGEPGNLMVTCCVKPHPYLHLDGKDLCFTLPATFVEAVQGASITVSLPDGFAVKANMAVGTQSGEEIRILGCGLKTKPGRRDLRLQIRVAVPGDLSKTTKQAMQAFTEATRNANPRAQLDRSVVL